MRGACFLTGDYENLKAEIVLGLMTGVFSVWGSRGYRICGVSDKKDAVFHENLNQEHHQPLFPELYE